MKRKAFLYKRVESKPFKCATKRGMITVHHEVHRYVGWTHGKKYHGQKLRELRAERGVGRPPKHYDVLGKIQVKQGLITPQELGMPAPITPTPLKGTETGRIALHINAPKPMEPAVEQTVVKAAEAIAAVPGSFKLKMGG